MIARRLAWPLMSAATAAAAGALTRVVVNRLWKVATGAEIPPERDEDAVSMGEAVAWAAGIGAARPPPQQRRPRPTPNHRRLTSAGDLCSRCRCRSVFTRTGAGRASES